MIVFLWNNQMQIFMLCERGNFQPPNNGGFFVVSGKIAAGVLYPNHVENLLYSNPRRNNCT